LSVRVKLPDGIHGNRLRLLASNRSPKTTVRNGWIHFELATVLDHEVAIIS
jgi:hypothetical protein